MDLEAYMQIDEFEQIAKDNNIVVPRLRGYRLMKDEKPVPEEVIERIMEDSDIDVCETLCCSEPFWSEASFMSVWNDKTKRRQNYYLIEDTDENRSRKYKGIRWDRIHGWKRKVLRLAIKKKRKRIREQYDMWNKYAGKDKVLYIHARIGGNNWNYYEGYKLMRLPWFLDKVDDYFDDTYCDIYASIE